MVGGNILEKAMFRILKKRKKTRLNSSPFARKGQVMLEFTFCMIVVLLMIYGVTKAFLWAGLDLAERNIAHESMLEGGGSPKAQIRPDFYTPVGMNTIWGGN